ncbi:unnamed protein product [Trifolium pratense]|uniref:Uncharacterized protein n=1 Tax=Trifolium pratense TaxID=57577 RepID=A0ACB0LQI2_TRIPR|nr:unnamed protein product [Trifolium pratense]
MLNGKSKIVILALSLFFSVVMVCFCCILVSHFVKEFGNVPKRSTRKNQDVLWTGFGISLFVIFAFAFVVFAVFSSCGIIYIIQCSTKIAPAPLEAGD